jgi:uncharacterized protein YcbK (DUF882 family)
MGDLSEHFSSAEMRCHDCGKCVISPDLLAALEQLRALGPELIIVDDAYRCPEHNQEVGGVSDSTHIEGIAADIRIAGLTLQQQYDRAKTVPGFAGGGIGVYDGGFIHVDVRKGKARWSRKGGVYLGLNVLVTP